MELISGYPKRFMSVSELEQMGFSRTYLHQMAHRRGQTYCTRTSNKGKAKFIFDVEKFEKARQKMLV